MCFMQYTNKITVSELLLLFLNKVTFHLSDNYWVELADIHFQCRRAIENKNTFKFSKATKVPFQSETECKLEKIHILCTNE